MQCHSTTLRQAGNAHIAGLNSDNVLNVVSGLLQRTRRMFIVGQGVEQGGAGA